MGQTPSTTSFMKSDWDSPTSSAILHITMEPSRQWSPMKMSWLSPRTMGTMHSSSVARVLASVKMGLSCPDFHIHLCS